MSTNQQEDVLQNYLDQMVNLLLNYHLQSSQPGDETQTVARALSLATLRMLDVNLKGVLLRFLADAQLLSVKQSIVNVSLADFSGVDLTGAFMPGISLIRVNLSNAILAGVVLTGSSLEGSDLSNANLQAAILDSTDLSLVNLSNADLTNANLFQAFVTQNQLNQALSLQGTILPDGTKHP